MSNMITPNAQANTSANVQGAGFMSHLRAVGQSAARFLPEPLSSGVSFASQLAGGASAGNTIDISPSYQALIEKQIQVQLEQQQITFTSNVEKSQHEARMAAVRNMRVS